MVKRTPAIALIADIALGAFLAMSLMSMQLWALVDLAGPIFVILGAQFVVAICVAIFVVFPLMGKTYDAAVVCAGFGGISLGSTPTAMANMSAVAQKYGNSHRSIHHSAAGLCIFYRPRQRFNHPIFCRITKLIYLI